MNGLLFVEAKAASTIRSEQIIDYIELATTVGVDTIITISNEFARLYQRHLTLTDMGPFSHSD